MARTDITPDPVERIIDTAIARSSTRIVKIDLAAAKIDEKVVADLAPKYLAVGWRTFNIADGTLTIA